MHPASVKRFILPFLYSFNFWILITFTLKGQWKICNVYLNYVIYGQEEIKALWTLCFSSGGPRMKGQEVVVHFIKIIKEPRYSCHVGVEYCKLLKNILSVPVYQYDLTVETWQGMRNMKSLMQSCCVFTLKPISLGYLRNRLGYCDNFTRKETHYMKITFYLTYRALKTPSNISHHRLLTSKHCGAD